MITQSFVKEHFHYNEKSGDFYWIKKTSPLSRVKLKEPIRTLHHSGYLVVTVYKRQHLVHRLIYLYMTGSFPEEVDHRDTNKTNNSWNNLRSSDRSGNQQNRNIPKNNTSGIKGITWNKKCQKWQASIKCKGILYYLGLHEDIARAKEILDARRKELHKSFFNNG